LKAQALAAGVGNFVYPATAQKKGECFSMLSKDAIADSPTIGWSVQDRIGQLLCFRSD
jgi:hypothetical protein